MEKRARSLIALIPVTLIIVLGFIVYADSLSGKFIWDDEFLIQENPYIKDWSCFQKVFTENIASGSEMKTRFYRPVQMVTYFLDYSLWRSNAKGYHLTNILLHIFTAIVVYWLVCLLYGNKYLSFLSSMLFIACPLHTEAVAYISGRADSLSAIFILLSLAFYIRQISLKNTATYILMLISYVFALLSKEYSLITPALLLLYSFSFRKKLLMKELFSLLGITAIYIILRLTVLNFPPPEAAVYTVFSQRIPGFFAAISEYTRLLFLPFDLHMEYGKKLFNFSDYKVILGAVILSTLLIYAWRKRKAGTLVSFSIFWFFITLLPNSNLYPINAYMAEHWLYLPSIGFFMILANILILLYRSKAFRNISLGLMVSILFFYSYLTIKQNNTWIDPVFFYKRTLKYAPDSFKLYHNLGKSYMEIGKNREAVKAFQKAIEINSKHANTYSSLGSAYNAIGEKEEAVSAYLKAIELNPRHADAYYNMGNAYAGSGNIEKAISAYEKAIEIAPKHRHSTAYYNNLAGMYARAGNTEKAISMYKKALELDPGNIKAGNNLQALLNSLNNHQEGQALIPPQ